LKPRFGQDFFAAKKPVDLALQHLAENEGKGKNEKNEKLDI